MILNLFDEMNKFIFGVLSSAVLQSVGSATFIKMIDLNIYLAIIAGAIWEGVVVGNLSTDAGEKVARKWFASRFAAGACAGCRVSCAFQLPD